MKDTATQAAGTPGKFIAIEGVDGAGKGVQSRILLQALLQAGVNCILTREPGGAAGAEEIRNLLVTGEADKWDALTELLLINAARRNHLVHTIWPALAAGTWVISDRFADSSRAFQGFAGDLGLELVDDFHAKVTGNFNPELTLILDLEPEQSLARTRSRGGNEDRFEKKGLHYQQRVRDGFVFLAKRSPQSHVLINAAGTVEEVAVLVSQAVASRLLAAHSLAAVTKGAGAEQ
jgi:dTMP kinase